MSTKYGNNSLIRVKSFFMARIKHLSKAAQVFETLAEFRYALRQFIHFSEKRRARRLSITPQQHQALVAIKGFPGRESVTIGELAERLQLRHHSAVGGLVDRLVVEKLVTRARIQPKTGGG